MTEVALHFDVDPGTGMKAAVLNFERDALP